VGQMPHQSMVLKNALLYVAHENGFGCVQNQSYRKMEIYLPILAVMKMVLNRSVQNQSLDKCEQISQFIAH
jgi:hypothetical protein